MSADLLARLIAAGTPADLVGEVAMAIASAQANADAQVRAALEPSAGALRTRRYRERHKASQSVTCDAGDAHVTGNVTRPAPAPSPLSSPQTPQQTPHPHPHPEGTDARTRKARLAAWPCPEGVDPVHWSDLIANRKSKRLANTATALAGIVRDLAKYADDEWPPGRIVQHAAERGWGAIFDPRQSQGPRRNAEHRTHCREPGRPVDGFTSALRRASEKLEAGNLG